jgi:hypothetical protein
MTMHERLHTAPFITAVIFALWVLIRPVFTFIEAALEARGYAYMNGLSRSLARRLYGYALTWIAVGTVPVIVTWSLL